MAETSLISRMRTGHVVLALAACVIGAVVPFFVSAMDDKLERLLALPAAIVLLVLFLYSRSLLLLLLILTRASCDVFFDSTRFGIGSIQIGVGGLVNIFAILIAFLLIGEKPKLFSRQILVTWAPFLLVVLFGTIISPYKASGVRIFLQLVSAVAIFIGAYFYVSEAPERFKRCVVLVVVSSIIPVFYGLFQAATHGGMNTEDAGIRVNSTFNHPNILAFYLTLITALMLYALKSPSFRLTILPRLILTIYLFLILALLVVTKTRSAWLACFAMFLMYGLLIERRYLIYLLILSLASLAIPEVHERVFEIANDAHHPVLSSTARLNSFDWRLAIWKAGLSWMSRSRYLIGYGLESFYFYSSRFFVMKGDGMGAHNVYVELFFEFGMLGIGTFLWTFYQLLSKLWLLVSLNRLAAFALVMLLIEYLVVAASDNLLGYLSFNWYLYFMCGAGMALAVPLYEKKRNALSRKPASTNALPTYAVGA